MASLTRMVNMTKAKKKTRKRATKKKSKAMKRIANISYCADNRESIEKVIDDNLGKLDPNTPKFHDTSPEFFWRVVVTLAIEFNPVEDICNVIGIGVEEFNDLCLENFALTSEQFLRKFRAKGRSNIRAWQYNSAKDGNVLMQKVLGEAELGQGTKVHHEVTGPTVMDLIESEE